MAYLRFSKIALVLLALSVSLSAQTVVRAGTQGTAWATATLCPNGSFVTATPDNLHVFKAIQAGTGTTGATQPVWNTISGLQTTDGTCLWKEAGPSGLGGSGGGGGGGSPPGGTLNSVQLNNNPNFAGSQAFSFDPNTLELFLQAIGAASPSQNVDSPKFHLRANYWDGAASAVDDWTLQSFTRPNGGGSTTRSFVKMLHSGTSGNSNGSSYTFIFDPLNIGVECAHEDPLFTTNPVTCFAIDGTNAAGSGVDLSLVNSASSGSQRTRIVQRSLGGSGLFHVMETDPNTTGSAEFGMVGCIPLNCYPYLFVNGFGGNLPELYLGGSAFTPTKAAVKFDIDNTGGSSTPRRSFVPLVPLDFDPTAVTTYLLSAKELAAPATPAATFEKLYFEATYGACAKDSTGRERCTGGSPTAGTYVVTGSFGACGSPPLGSQSALCFGPGGNIQGSYAGDAFDTFLRASSYSATGLLCCVGLSQVDLAAFDGRYETVDSIAQYVIPEGGAPGSGLQNSPCVDSAAGILICNTVLDAGAGIPNDTSTGTTLGLLMKLSAGKMVKIGTGDTNIPVFLCTNLCGTTGNTYPLMAGIGSCTFDGPTIQNDFAGASSTVAGDCTDLGSSFAAINGNKAVIGQVLTTNGSAGTYSIFLTQAAQTPFYQTIRENSTDQTQRSKLRLISGAGATVNCADNSGAGSTDCTIASSAGAATVKAWTLSPGTAGVGSITANATKLWEIQFPVTITLSTNLVYDVATADNTGNLYNLALFNTSGTIVCQTAAVAGTTIASSTGVKKIAWTSTCGPLVAGTVYYFAMTGDHNTFVLGGTSGAGALCFAAPTSNNTTASAVWTTPIGIPADTLAACNLPEVGVN